MERGPQACPTCGHFPCKAVEAVNIQPPGVKAVLYECPNHTPSIFVVEFQLTEEEIRQRGQIEAIARLAVGMYELRRQVEKIEQYEVHLKANGPVSAVPPYNGIVEYQCSNGWRLAVFWDCGEWDYFEWIETSDGRRVTYAELDAAGSYLADYHPADETPYGGPYKIEG